MVLTSSSAVIFWSDTEKTTTFFFGQPQIHKNERRTAIREANNWQKLLCFYASLYRGFQVGNSTGTPTASQVWQELYQEFGLWHNDVLNVHNLQHRAGGKASQLDGMLGMLMNSLVFPLDEFLVTWIDTVFNSLIQNQTPKKQWHFLSRCAITSNNQPGLSKSTINKSDVLQLPITTLHFNSQPLPGQRPHWPVHDHSVAAWIICCSSPSLPVRCRWWTSQIEMLVLQKYIIPLTKRSYYTRLCDYIYIIYTLYTTIISSRKKQ